MPNAASIGASGNDSIQDRAAAVQPRAAQPLESLPAPASLTRRRHGATLPAPRGRGNPSCVGLRGGMPARSTHRDPCPPTERGTMLRGLATHRRRRALAAAAAALVVASGAAATSSSSSASSSQADRLRVIERTRLQALVDGDVAAARKLTAPDFQLINPAGAPLSRADFLAPVAAGVLDFLVLAPRSRIAVRMSGDS